MTTDIAQLVAEALEDHAAATKPPWSFSEESGLVTVSLVDPEDGETDSYVVADCWGENDATRGRTLANMRFIARSRDREWRLAEEVRRLSEENERLREIEQTVLPIVDNSRNSNYRRRVDLEAQLAAMTAARDELAGMVVALLSVPHPQHGQNWWPRIDELRAVGKEPRAAAEGGEQ